MFNFNDSMDDIDRLTSHSLLYLKSKHSVLIMADIGPKVYLYSLITKECEKIQSMSGDLYLSGAVLTKDERFVICFMGTLHIDEIDVLDLNTMKFTTSPIKSPKGIYDVCIHSDTYKEDIIVSAYIHQHKLKDEIPSDITKMIQSFISFEVIYCLCSPQLYSLKVDDILNFQT